MYNKILVPLDGSKRAEAILRHVEELAQRYNAKIVLVKVVEPILISGPEGATMDLRQQEFETRTKAAEAYLAALKGEFREKRMEAIVRVVHGPVVEEIINTAEREAVDIIALASHGRTGLSRVFYGSVAAGVLHRVDRPLLIIRSEGEA